MLLWYKGEGRETGNTLKLYYSIADEVFGIKNCKLWGKILNNNALVGDNALVIIIKGPKIKKRACSVAKKFVLAIFVFFLGEHL